MRTWHVDFARWQRERGRVPAAQSCVSAQAVAHRRLLLISDYQRLAVRLARLVSL